MPPLLPRRQHARVAARVLPVLLLAGLLLGPLDQPAGAHAALPATAPAAGAATGPNRLTIELLPPIRQPGARAAASSRASSVVAITLTPATRGRRVDLQRRVAGTWRLAASAVTGRQGRATFFVPATQAGAPVAYRAVAPRHGDLQGQHSSAVLADTWGTPDFVDDFTGDSLGAAWEHRIQYYNPWGGRSCSKGAPDAVSVAGGVLRLSSMVDPAATGLCTPTDADGEPVAQAAYPFRLNANISTQHSADFLYGVAAARMRFPKSMGQHAALWLQPRGLLETGPTTWGAEVDVIEWYGHDHSRSRFSSSVHVTQPDGSKRQIGGPVSRPDRFLVSRTDAWWTRFHVFSVEWTPHEYIFRIAGHEAWRTDQGVSDVPEFVILSMLSSDYELPDVGTDPEPRTAEVDWVAFWQSD